MVEQRRVPVSRSRDKSLMLPSFGLGHCILDSCFPVTSLVIQSQGRSMGAERDHQLRLLAAKPRRDPTLWRLFGLINNHDKHIFRPGRLKLPRQRICPATFPWTAAIAPWTSDVHLA